MDTHDPNNTDLSSLHNQLDTLRDASAQFEKDVEYDDPEVERILAELAEERAILRPVLAELTYEDEADFKALLQALAETQ